MTDQVAARRRYVRRGYAQKVALVQALCRRLEAGESISEACRDPTMMQRSTLISWLTHDLELRGMVEAAQAAAAEVYGRRRTYHRWDPDVAAEVLARIEDGRGLREVCAEPDMPAHQTVTRWLNERPDYAEAYRRTREAQADRLFDLAWRIAQEATEAEVATARLKIQTLKWRVGKLAPKKYGAFKAQEPPAAEDDEAPAEGARRMVFEARRFARTPDNQVVETTRAVRGMTPEQQAQLRAAIADGRLSLEALRAMEDPT